MGRTTTQSLDSEHPKRFNSRLGKLIIATNFDAHDSELDLSGRFDTPEEYAERCAFHAKVVAASKGFEDFGHKIDGEGGICGKDTIAYRLSLRDMKWTTYRPVYRTILDVLTQKRWSS